MRKRFIISIYLAVLILICSISGKGDALAEERMVALSDDLVLSFNFCMPEAYDGLLCDIACVYKKWSEETIHAALQAPGLASHQDVQFTYTEDQVQYYESNQASVSFGLGDMELRTTRMNEIYEPICVQTSPSNSADVGNYAYRMNQELQELLISQNSQIHYGDTPYSVRSWTQNDLDYLENNAISDAERQAGKQAAPFFLAYYPIFFHNIELYPYTIYLNGQNRIIGKNVQILCSNKGLEFFYSGKSILQETNMISQPQSVLSPETVMELLKQKYTASAWSRSGRIEVTSLHLYYLTAAEPIDAEHGMLIPAWVFSTSDGEQAFHATTGEILF